MLLRKWPSGQETPSSLHKPSSVKPNSSSPPSPLTMAGTFEMSLRAPHLRLPGAMPWLRGSALTGPPPYPTPNFRRNRGGSETCASKPSPIRGPVLWQDGGFFPVAPSFLPPPAPCQPFLGGSLVRWRTVTRRACELSAAARESCACLLAGLLRVTSRA